MRTVSQTIADAIDTAYSYRTDLRAVIEPSRLYIDTIDQDNPWNGADANGWHDDVTRQSAGYNAACGVATFFLQGGQICYTLQGNASIVTTGHSSAIAPSCLDNSLYYVSGGTVYQATINWSAVAARSGSILSNMQALGTPTSAPLSVHGLEDGSAAAVLWDDGGLRACVCNGSAHEQTYRFMYPRAIDYTSGSAAAEKTQAQMAAFTAAAMLNGKAYVYVSNLYDGTVQGVCWDSGVDRWSDIFTAVPTQVTESMCELRTCNAFVRAGVLYLVGFFRRTENAEIERCYTMILPSQDGKIFAIDRFSFVSALGYPFQALVAEPDIYLASCNRVTSGSLPYTFNGTSGSGHLQTLIPAADILSFQDNNAQQASLILAAGDERSLNNSLVQQSARVKIYISIYTSAGVEEILYGTYIIDRIDKAFRDGERALQLGLTGECDWRLSGQSNPYYAEYLSRSSLHDTAEENTGNMYVAPSTVRYDSRVIVDLWNGDDIPSSDDPAVDTSMNAEDGALVNVETSGSHKIGICCRDLMSMSLSLHDYPKVLESTVSARLYGWSHDQTAGGSDNDLVRLSLWTKNLTTKAVTYRQSTGGHFPNTYPVFSSGSHPLLQTISDIPVGDVIVRMGMTAESLHGTDFLPAAIELMGGVEIPLDYIDSNTGWDSTPDKGYKLPDGNRPYIMFSQQPFDAWNFRCAARFNCTVPLNSGITNYAHGIGLVGLATDGANFLTARADYNQHKIQIVKSRRGHETVLASASPSISFTDWFSIMFEHRDGDLVVSLMDNANVWIEQLRYRWKETDGWMVMDYSAAKKCGIYGNLSGPWFRITGYDPLATNTVGGEETTTNADGLPFIPGYNVTDFPSSGIVRISKSKFSYTGKVPFDQPRGPYQYRQNGLYSPPYGDGQGLELLDFDWTGTVNMAGKLLAMDDGSSYLIDHSLWQIWITTDGARIDLTNRSRQYSLNANIGDMLHSMDCRVFITGGLTGVQKTSGADEYYSYGDVCTYFVPGDVWCRWFYGSSGDSDATLRDLIERISATAGARTVFPGDQVRADFSGTVQLPTLEYVEGVDLRFTTAGDFEVTTNIKKPDGTNGVSVACALGASASFTFTLDDWVENLAIDESGGTHNYRLLLHDNFVTLYRDDAWVHTFSTAELVYPNQTQLSMTGSSVSGVRLIELSDWREAIYIDLESDANSALSSIIQERPIESYTRSDGSKAFWYERTRDVITPGYQPRQHSWSESVPQDGASDAIVYGSRDVRCIQNMDYAERYGFATKIVRCPNLNVGALRAARVMLRRIYESGTPHELSCRPDPRVEAGDQMHISYTATGTGRVVDTNVIVEQVALSYSGDGRSEMGISGREAS